MAHESFSRKEVSSGSSERVFGWVFAVVFLVVGLFPLAFGGTARTWALATAAVLAVIATLRPVVLAPLNRLWAAFGGVLHRITSPLVLGILFLGIITPMGLVMRALKKDPLRLRARRHTASYWIDRTGQHSQQSSFRDQF